MPDTAPAERVFTPPVSSPGAEQSAHTLADEPKPGDWVRVLLIVTLIGSALARLAAAHHLSPHIDEPASVLAARMVAERGAPIFPSGVPYFQGATLSYLLQPMLWLGLGDINDLHALRMASVIAGVLAVFVTYLLGVQVSGKRWVGLIAAFLLAIEPASIKWSGLVRMYALIELASVVLALIFITILMDGVTRFRLIGLVAVIWFAVFTQIAVVLALPALLLLALAVYGRSLWHERRDLGCALGLGFFGPVALVVLNRLLQTSSAPASAGGNIPGISFVGDHLFRPSAILNPALTSWEDLFLLSTLQHVTPYLMVFLSAALFGLWFLASDHAGVNRRSRIAVGSLLAFYWIPVLIVGVTVTEAQERYLLLIVPPGAVLVATATMALIDSARRIMSSRGAGWQSRSYIGAAIGVTLLLVIQQGSGILGLSRYAHLDPDYTAAARWVEVRRNPGELVIAAMTPAPYLVFGRDATDLQFLSGNAYSLRTQRYTRVSDDGTIVDYWIGVPSISLVSDLCLAIEQNPKAWILVDRTRLYGSTIIGGNLAQVIDGMTYVAWIDTDRSMMVLRPSPAPSHTGRADAICAQAKELAAKGITETTWPTPPLVFR